MTATLRYDIGIGAAQVLLNYEGSSLPQVDSHVAGEQGISLLTPAGAKHVLRWAGVAHGGWNTHALTFALKLPIQVHIAYKLMHRAYWLARDLRKLPPGRMPQAIDGTAKRSLGTLANKLSLSLGIGDPGMIGVPDIFSTCDEDAFTGAIHEAPDDLANWMAYGDWLQERDNEKMRCRGRVIAGWLGKKALKMKYGVPIIAQPNKWAWLQEKE